MWIAHDVMMMPSCAVHRAPCVSCVCRLKVCIFAELDFFFSLFTKRIWFLTRILRWLLYLLYGWNIKSHNLTLSHPVNHYEWYEHSHALPYTRTCVRFEAKSFLCCTKTHVYIYFLLEFIYGIVAWNSANALIIILWYIEVWWWFYTFFSALLLLKMQIIFLLLFLHFSFFPSFFVTGGGGGVRCSFQHIIQNKASFYALSFSFYPEHFILQRMLMASPPPL